MINTSNHLQRLRVALCGRVQGVGFRPFVFRLAGELSLNGWVGNTAQGVLIEAEASPSALNEFLLRLERDLPPQASIHSLEATWLDPSGYKNFEIRQSQSGNKSALVMADIAS